MSKRLFLGLFILIAGACLLPCRLPIVAISRSVVQDAAASEIAAEFKHRLVMLRSPYCGKKLKFDAAATLVSGGQPGYRTVCACIQIRDIRIGEGKLEITGQRVYWPYDSRSKQLPEITKAESEANKKTRNDKEVIQEQKVSIEVQLLQHADKAVITALMDKLFDTSEPRLPDRAADSVKALLGPGLDPNSYPGGEIFRLGKAITAPVPIYSPSPGYTDEARRANYQGTVVLTIIVGPDGRVHNAKVSRAVGMGLDEKAIETVRTWRFKPATKDGKPVAVAVSVEVEFRL